MAFKDLPTEIKKATIKAVVAPRRSVMLEEHRCGPGSIIDLPPDTVKRLTVLGFLVADDNAAPAPTPASGPQFQGAVNGVVKLS